MCCGMIFDSRGYRDVGGSQAAALQAALLEASEAGRYPIVCDTSPCLQLCAVRAGAVHLDAPQGAARVLARAAVGRRPRAVLLQEAQAQRHHGAGAPRLIRPTDPRLAPCHAFPCRVSVRRAVPRVPLPRERPPRLRRAARRALRERGARHAHPVLRHGGRPRHALPGADRGVAAAPRPARQLLRRLLDQPHVRDVALQPLGRPLPLAALPGRRGDRAQAARARRAVGAPWERSRRGATARR
eukprot:228246-Prymnesium_polylepis.1